ncbi:unnamed protein product [Lampetra planeri]
MTPNPGRVLQSGANVERAHLWGLHVEPNASEGTRCRSDIATCKATRKSCRRWDSHHRGDTRCGHGDRHPRCVPSPPPSSFLFCSGPACAGHAGRRWVVEREGEEVARRSRRSQNANATAATATVLLPLMLHK